MRYTARAVLRNPPHGEWPGIEITAMENTGKGWALSGSVARSTAQDWERWNEEAVDLVLDGMGWVRTGGWISGGGCWYAHVERA